VTGDVGVDGLEVGDCATSAGSASCAPANSGDSGAGASAFCMGV
jgi:hypothetical protein